MRLILFCTILFICVCALIACESDKTSDTAPLYSSTSSSMAAVQAEDDRDYLNQDITLSRKNAITMAIANVSPAIVGINVTQVRRYVQRYWWDNDPFWDWLTPRREYRQQVQGLGSGFLISPDGYILTNEHVVHEAVKIVVTTTDGEQHEAVKVGEDMTYDVSLLKIEGNAFPYIPLGDSDDIIIGEWVVALGNPFGLFDINAKPTVTVGVVSASGMDFKVENRSYQDMIQTDASINQGNSGGPLVNSLGHCIGINTVIMTGNQYNEGSIGIGFAIPMNRVKRILPDLKTVGRVDRSFQTGLEVESISYLMARMLGISQRDGVIVSRVTRRSPADRAGIQTGDVIVAIEGTRVRSTTDVQRIINMFDVTEDPNMKITVYRDGELREVEMTVEK